MEHERDPAPALTRGLRLLAKLDQDGPASLEHLAQLTGWPKTSVLRLLQCLAQAGLVRRDEKSKRFHALMRLLPIEPGGAFLRNAAAPAMAQLCQATGHTVELHRFDQGALEMIDRCESEQTAVPVRARIGWRRNLDEADALTRIVLTFGLPQPEWPPLAFWSWREGKKTRLSQHQLAQWLKETRARRTAYDAQPNPNGILRLSAPVLNRAGGLEAVLAIARAFSPGTPQPDARLLKMLSAAAARITGTLHLAPAVMLQSEPHAKGL